MSHPWSGPHGIPGSLERWQHGSYRWRRGLEAAFLVVLAVVLAPKVLALAEVVVGAALMALGLLWLAWMVLPHRCGRRLDLLALALAILALLQARKRPRDPWSDSSRPFVRGEGVVMPIFKNPWQRQAELIYQAADQLVNGLTRLPALQPLEPRQESDLFYESLYYLNLVCDKILAENLSERRGGDDLETRINLTLDTVGDRIEKLVLARIGLTAQGPGYEEWERAFYTAMKERRGRYGEMDPQQVTDGFGRVALQTLGKAASESIVSEIARTALRVVRANDLIANTQRLSQIVG